MPSFTVQRAQLQMAWAETAAAGGRPPPTLFATEPPGGDCDAVWDHSRQVMDLCSLTSPAALHPDADADSWPL